MPHAEEWLTQPNTFNAIKFNPAFNGQALVMGNSSILYKPAILEYTDLEAEVLLTSDRNTRGTLVARVQDLGTNFYYRYHFSVFANVTGGVALYRRLDTHAWQLGAGATYVADPACPVFRMRLVVDGFHLKGYVNDVLMVEAEDPLQSFPAGRVGLEAYGGAWYDAIRVNNQACAVAPAPPVPTVPPVSTSTFTSSPTPSATPTASPSSTSTFTSTPTASPTSTSTPTSTPSQPCLASSSVEGAGMEPWPQPADAVQLGDLSLNGHEARELEAGDYVVDTLTLNGSSSLRAKSPRVRIWFRQLALAGQASLDAEPAGQLWLFSRVDATQAGIQGNAKVQAGIYAPNIPVSLGGAAGLEGAVLAGDVVVKGRAGLTYDPSLGQGCGKAALPKPEGPAQVAHRGDTKLESQGVLKQNQTLLLYPNPAKDRAWASYRLPQSGRGRLLLLNLGGELVKALELRGQPGEGRVMLSLAGLSAGTYLALLQTDEGMGQAGRATFKFALLP